MMQFNLNSAARDFSALADFSRLINSSLELDFTLNNLVLTCMGKFHSTKAAVYFKEADDKYKLVYSKGDLKYDSIKFGKFDIENLPDELKEQFPLIKPIKGRGEELGFLCLGPKLTKNEYSDDDIRFLSLILNIAATAIENSLTFEKLNVANKELDSKLNQLSSLFDLSKEFSGLLDVKMVTRLFVFSLIGQLMITDYAVLLAGENELLILDSKFDKVKVKNVFEKIDIQRISSAVTGEQLNLWMKEESGLNISLAIPMRIKDRTRGVILLGERKNKHEYTKSDIEFVSSLAGIAIISIENARLVEEAIERQKLEKELETAREIQKSLLPQSPPKLKRFDISAYSESAKQVGGDYYDIIPLDTHRTLIAIADVSGKGVQASLLMANLQAFLKSLSKLNYELDKASNILNDLVSENTRMGHFITFFWGIIDSEKMTLNYVNAGHNPPLLSRGGELIQLKKGGMILGFMKTIVPYVSEEIEIMSNDILVLFTDGITEAMDPDNREYSDERLERLVLDIPGDDSAEEILESIKNDVLTHTQGNIQSDDITCMIVKVTE
jgi:sigma-B regulation protein RsbU (phosphoserine phosphatase)